jgi:hypothetical protein
VSDNTTTPNTWQGSAGVSGTAESAPMTRRERREREQREAEALAAQTASVPVVAEPTTVPDTEQVKQHEVEQAAEPVSPPQEPAPAVPEQRHIPQPTQPMTRRERREMEERLRLEQEAASGQPEVTVPAPQPAAASVDTGVSVVDDYVDTPEPVEVAESEPVAVPEVPHVAAPLPPVFDTPVAPPRSGFPIIADELDDEEAELASSRQVGSGSPATHALILPTTPTVDIAGPMGDTGEILVTGQIPLPRLVTETGMQGGLDEDERFDELIGAETTPLTSPVSARSAVSSKGNDSEFQMVRKAPWGTAATVLGASAVLLVLAAAGLLTVALLTDILTWPF